MTSDWNTTHRSTLQDMIEEGHSCGVWKGRHPAPSEGQPFKLWALENRKMREENAKNAENNCRNCGLNRFMFDPYKKKKVMVCDYWMAADRVIEDMYPGKVQTAVKKDLAELHQSCEFVYRPRREECIACPLSTPIRSTNEGGMETTMVLCEAMSNYQKRPQDTRNLKIRGLPLNAAGADGNRFGGVD